MCEDCPPEVKALAMRLADYIDRHDSVIAGGLHIVIEDENVADDHIRWCQANAGLDDESVRFADELLAMPVPFRHMAVQLAWDDRERQSWEEEELCSLCGSACWPG